MGKYTTHCGERSIKDLTYLSQDDPWGVNSLHCFEIQIQTVQVIGLTPLF